VHISDLGEKLVIYINKILNLDEMSALILKIKDKNYEIKDFDNIVIYEDKVIGTILEVNRGEENYFGVLDINVSKAKEQNFLLKLEENIDFNISADTYRYKNNYYIKLKDQKDIIVGRVLEYAKIIYGSEISKIMKEENKINGGIVIWKKMLLL